MTMRLHPQATERVEKPTDAAIMTRWWGLSKKPPCLPLRLCRRRPYLFQVFDGNAEEFVYNVLVYFAALMIHRSSTTGPKHPLSWRAGGPMSPNRG